MEINLLLDDIKVIDEDLIESNNKYYVITYINMYSRNNLVDLNKVNIYKSVERLIKLEGGSIYIPDSNRFLFEDIVRKVVNDYNLFNPKNRIKLDISFDENIINALYNNIKIEFIKLVV